MVGSWQVARQAKGVVWPVVRRVLRLLDRVHLSLARLVGDPHRTRGADAHERVSEYWSSQFEAMRVDQSYWMNNRLVEEWTYRLMTGTPQHWLNWLLNEYFVQRTFERSLSVCCGDGAHEIQLYRSGKVRRVIGVDLSSGAIAQAKARFEAAAAPPDRYRFTVQDVNVLDVDGMFDLILSTGALHHATNLETLLARLEQALTPDGYFVVVEFIGPNRFQWTDRQIEIANKVLGALDPAYLRDGTCTRFERPTIASMLACDPSEAVRSADVFPLVRQHFEVCYERCYNGTLLHQLHPLLKTELANQGRRDFDSIVRLILLLEDMLVKHGVLASDFVFLICRKRQGVAQRLS
ncbi:class I SAM-dependent methyltransferase [Nitrospirales bacterium NOB]|mgnify:CR=1 FL=1|nr:Ubiquinone/menaquinone biosynthesis C-methyltransferase UbiE [Nitrospirota bacterium]MCK6492356.1 class I SAM-dependent methyltransferase [Nitrospira sp.]MDL1890072.1 class I SAM-dependent methyltransferase [Nitrospirales bacterium NOB]MEB2338079.1 class I SAM-dependent methyltransferase [Nitrospirales bacterium]QOJ36284.1 MAG: class I SAM-dependent methyltransferase [Nitrospira sp.]